MQKFKLSVSAVLADFENGLTRPEVAKKYGLSVGALNKALKEKNLNTIRAKQKTWEWVDEDKPQETPPDVKVVEDGNDYVTVEEIFPGITAVANGIN